MSRRADSRRTWSLNFSPSARSVRTPLAFHGLQSLQPARWFPDFPRLWCISDPRCFPERGVHARLPAGTAGLEFRDHLLVEAQRHLFLRSEEHTSELQSLMRISYAVFCL